MKHFKKTLLLLFSLVLGLIAVSQNTYAIFSGNITGLTDLGNGLYRVNTNDQRFPVGMINGSHLGGLQNLSMTNDSSNHEVSIYWIDSDGIRTYHFYVDELAFDTQTITNIEFDMGQGFRVVISDATYVSDDELDQTGTLFINYKTVDSLRPAISGQENFVTNVDDPKDVNFFKSYLSAYDETDGDITSNITVKTDNYTANKTTLGTHKIVFSVKDSANNETTLDVYVRVVDITAPVITGDTSVATIGYSETYNFETFRKTLTVTDNYATLTNTDIKLKTDGYSSNKTILGTYSVVFEVTDPSGNASTFTKQVKVIDNVKPTFSGPSTITTTNKTPMTVNDVKAELTANDFIDGVITNKITVKTDNYTGHNSTVGSYSIVFEVKDTAGNTQTHTVTINLVDNIAPIFWIKDGYSIKVDPSVALTKEQIIEILTVSGQITQQTPMSRVRVLYDDYTGRESKPGIYAMNFEIASDDDFKNTTTHAVAITVLGESETPPDSETPTIIDQGLGFIQQHYLWFIGGFVVLIISIIFLIPKKKTKRSW